jgi:hypothetical protein
MVSAARSVLIRSAFLVCIATASAVAQEAEEDPLAIEARAACTGGDVERGVRLLEDYFARTKDPTAVYNMARCYQLNGKVDPALARFQEYLRRVPDLAPDERRQVDEYVRELERQRTSAVPQSTPPRPPPPAVPTAEATPAIPPDTVATQTPLRTLGIVLGGVGLLAVGAGLYFGAEVRSANDDLAEELAKPSPSARTYTDRLEDGQRAETLQWVFLGVGGAALLSGAACYVFGLPPSPERGAAVVAWPLPGGGAAGVRGAY